MNTWIRRVSVGAAAALLATGAQGREGAFPIRVSNSAHIEYDDNINQTETDKVDSLKFSNQVTLSWDRPMEQSFIGLRYHLIATWWEERTTDEWTFDHVVDAIFRHQLSPRLSLRVVDKLLLRDSPELIGEDGTLIRRDATYLYNSLNAALSSTLTALTRADIDGRWQFIRYDDDGVAEREDYDIYSAGLTLRNQYCPETSVLGELRYEKTEYTDAGKAVAPDVELPGATGGDRSRVPDRGYTSLIAALGAEHMFSPNLMGRASVGYMWQMYDAANSDRDTSPYVDASLTVVPTPDTRLTLAANYSLYQSSLLTYANQERTALSLSIGHDVTPRLSFHLAGSYVHSDYKAKLSVDTVAEGDVEDGAEDAYVLAARAVYRIDRARRHSLETGVSHTNLSSDLREDFTRNRYDVAWRFQL